MPAFSYYKSWKILDAEKAKSIRDMHALWIDYFIHHPDMQSKETKLFAHKGQYKIFSDRLKQNLNNYGISRTSVFNAIHTSYAQSINSNWEPKIIISEEHINLPLKTMMTDFPESKIIFIIREPKSAISGYMKLFSKRFSDLPDYFDYYFNLAYEQWFLAWDVYQSIKNDRNKYIIIKNETMSNNTESEMKIIAKKLGIDFDDILTKETFSNGGKWTLDSAYADRDGNLPNHQSITKFLDPIAIEKRWNKELFFNDILMIEIFFHQFFKEFNYQIKTEISLKNRFKAYFNYLKPRRTNNKLQKLLPNQHEFDRTEDRLIAQGRSGMSRLFSLMPKIFKRIFIYIESVKTRASILFFPSDRWNRYDNKGCYDV